MVHTEEGMRVALDGLYWADPEAVRMLAEEGPMEEPWCAVCSVCKPIIWGRLPGHTQAVKVLDYHDEATAYVYDPEDYLTAIGLADLITYQRCLRVYAAARALV